MAPSPPPADPVAGPMVPECFVVRSSRRDTADTSTLELFAPDLEMGLAFAPGQFTMLAAGGAGEVPISISGDPGQPQTLVHTVRAVGLATRAICAAQPGEALSVRGPFGRAWPVAELGEGADVVVVAGGIGLAPLRPAILALLARREHYGRLVLLYGARSPDQLLYEADLDEWSQRGFEVHTTVDSAGPEWLGRVGVVTRLLARAELHGATFDAMLCGPEVMMRLTALALLDAGVDPRRLHISTERNMQCGIGHCGHCQLGPSLVCRDGPVYSWAAVAPWLQIREL